MMASYVASLVQCSDVDNYGNEKVTGKRYSCTHIQVFYSTVSAIRSHIPHKPGICQGVLHVKADTFMHRVHLYGNVLLCTESFFMHENYI